MDEDDQEKSRESDEETDDLFEILGLEPMNSETEENVPNDCSSNIKTKAGTQLKIPQ